MNSSDEEYNFDIHIQYAFFRDSSVNRVINGIKLGYECGLFDYAFYLEKRLILFEYDGGYYHTEERLERDRQKCENALQKYENCLIIRVRVKAAPLLIQHKNIIVISVNTCKIETIVYEVAKQLVEHIDDPYKQHLMNTCNEKRMICDNCFVQLVKILDDARRHQIQILHTFLEEKHIEKLLHVHGMKSGMQLFNISEEIKKINDIHKIKGDKLVTFMCSSVASALVKSPDKFWSGIDTLANQGITGDKLVTFMGDSVASALVKSPDKFWSGIDMLVVQGIKGDKLVTLMHDSVAAALIKDAHEFFNALSKLKENGFSLDKIVSILREYATLKPILEEVLKKGPNVTRSDIRTLNRKRKRAVF